MRIVIRLEGGYLSEVMVPPGYPWRVILWDRMDDREDDVEYDEDTEGLVPVEWEVKP